jgi:hypothetical protein
VESSLEKKLVMCDVGVKFMQGIPSVSRRKPHFTLISPLS